MAKYIGYNREAGGCYSQIQTVKPSYMEEILHSEGGEALAQVAQRSCGCPIPGGVQGQAGWGLGQH